MQRVSAPMRLHHLLSISLQGYTFQENGEFYPYSKRLIELLKEHCKDPVEVRSRGDQGMTSLSLIPRPPHGRKERRQHRVVVWEREYGMTGIETYQEA